jgi:hypothetical protein
MFTGRKARDRGERAVWKAKADNMVRRVAKVRSEEEERVVTSNIFNKKYPH